MRRSDLSIVSSSLHLATKTLYQRWDQTGETWRDAVRTQYEEQHLAQLEPTVLATLKAINRLSLVLARAIEECS